MSVKVMSSIWEHSPHKGSELLLLLAIADNADDLGVAWPSQETLASKMRMSVRQVRRVSGLVEAAGAMTTTRKRSGSKTYIVYTLTLPTGQDVPLTTGQDVCLEDEIQPDISDFQPDIAVSAEPSLVLQPSQEQDQELAALPPTRTERDLVWDALTDIFGPPLTRTAQSLRGRIVSSLLEAGATVAQIAASPEAYRARMPGGTTFTETALEKHWSLLLMPVENVKRASTEKYGRSYVSSAQMLAKADQLDALADERRQLAPG